jgi:hypothetical protein
MSWIVGYCLVTVAASVLVSSLLAIVWARSRSPVLFAVSMAGVWVAMSTLPLSTRSWESVSFPADAAHFFATMFWAGPFVIAGVLALAGLVAAGAARDKILVASVVAAVVAVPISFLTGIYGACSLGDCL